LIDGTVYPDARHGNAFEDDYDRADYLDRVCAAWDFGVPPDPRTVRLFRHWRRVFDRFPVSASASYHTFRSFFQWPAVAMEAPMSKAHLEILDDLEGRVDPVRDRV